ncbi:hypothetical protein [Burkholderia cepacia]|uniref:hypothetical protein n=1 Tax=Burkholderia cepacia TaxID=292 RepID=UPI0007538897|nr:hypothetical protein [Burkholderia cepacia]KWH56292.1 hypothetical protein WM00_13670 [Burkholderia cepacia]
MQRINSPDGHFHAGDPSSGIKGTIVTRDFMESVQEELAAIPESVGLKLDKADNRQILKAIQKMFADAGSGLRSDVEKRYQLQLGYTPVQQGTGVDQAGNVVKMGWAKDASGLRVTVDAKDLGRVVFEDRLAPYATQEWARKNCVDPIGGKVNRAGDKVTGDLVLAADKGKYSPVLGLSCPGYIVHLQACVDEGGIVAIVDKSGKVRNFVVRDNGTAWVRDTLDVAHLSSRGDATISGRLHLRRDGDVGELVLISKEGKNAFLRGRHDGGMEWVNNAYGAVIASMDDVGWFHAKRLESDSDIQAGNNVHAGGGISACEAVIRSTDGTLMRLRGRDKGGGMFWVNNANNAVVASMDDAGSLNAGYVESRGDIKANGTLHAAGATFAQDGNVNGTIWGGWLRDWLNGQFSARDNNINTRATWAAANGKADHGAQCVHAAGVNEFGSINVGFAHQTCDAGSPWVLVGIRSQNQSNVTFLRAMWLKVA